ncbi:hypothetical protein ABZ511_27715 [Nocardia gamkensis]|uniref:hypothetical protein n=1 Tax=Nocardia gamkensis TaxID=352869 RepID=UPI0033D2EE88
MGEPNGGDVPPQSLGVTTMPTSPAFHGMLSSGDQRRPAAPRRLRQLTLRAT